LVDSTISQIEDRTRPGFMTGYCLLRKPTICGWRREANSMRRSLRTGPTHSACTTLVAREPAALEG
jgi:hypothetical protein